MQSQTQQFGEKMITVRRKPGPPSPHFRASNSEGWGHPEQIREPLGPADKMCAAWNRENGPMYNKHTNTRIYIHTVNVGIYMQFCSPYTCTTCFRWYYITVNPLLISKFLSMTYIGDLSTSVYTDLLQSFQLLHSNSSMWVHCRLNILWLTSI